MPGNNIVRPKRKKTGVAGKLQDAQGIRSSVGKIRASQGIHARGLRLGDQYRFHAVSCLGCVVRLFFVLAATFNAWICLIDGVLG
jgi:hypothetical protein